MKRSTLRTATLFLSILGCAWTLSSCGKGLKTTAFGCSSDFLAPKDPGQANSNFTAGAGLFTVSPVPTGSISAITPLGNLNPPGHTYPTDHIYLQLSSASANSTNVYAAAAGTVYSLYKPGGVDTKIVIQVDKSFYYYYDHINPAAGISEGSSVSAGQLVGTNSGNAAAVDLGVVNYNVTRTGFLDTCLFNISLHADAPIPYFTSALQTTLYGLVPGTASSNKDGSIDYDVAGTLQGAWIEENAAEDNPIVAIENLTFGVDPYFPSSPRIAIAAGKLSLSGLYGVQASAPAFNSVTPSNGFVIYTLYQANPSSVPSGSATGLLLVEMLTSGRIRVETFSGNAATGFDGKEFYYVR